MEIFNTFKKKKTGGEVNKIGQNCIHEEKTQQWTQEQPIAKYTKRESRLSSGYT